MIPRQASEQAIAARRRWLAVSRGIQACVFVAAVIGVITVWKRHVIVAGGGAAAPTSAASRQLTLPTPPAISKLAPDASAVQVNANRAIVR